MIKISVVEPKTGTSGETIERDKDGNEISRRKYKIVSEQVYRIRGWQDLFNRITKMYSIMMIGKSLDNDYY
jgi:hypothetical protein